VQPISNQLRQGDVLVTPRAIPKSATPEKPDGRVVLAEGEATGHAHAILDVKAVEVLRDGSETYLRVKSPTEITHEEHNTLKVEPGEYLIRRQVETWMDEVRQVAD
jgi:hypothetical protein